MSFIIDRKEIINYGFYTNDSGDIFPFSVEILEVEGEQESVEISWDDDQPENVDKIENQLMELFED